MRVIHRLKLLRAREVVVSVAVALIAFCAYVSTLAPGLPFNDGPELATAASVLSIAHPTGYPSFTLLGRVAVLVFGALEPIVALNLLGAILVSLSCALVFHVSLLLFHRLEPTPESQKNRSTEVTDWWKVLAAGVASLTFAFIPTVWKQAVEVEVHALQLFLVVLGLGLYFRAIRWLIVDHSKAIRLLLVFAYVMGLSFSNHLTTILLVPSYMFLFFSTLKWRSGSRIALRMAFPFFVGLSTYLYLPIRSSVAPPLNWGDPAEWSRFVWHVSGRGYRALMAGEGGTNRNLVDIGSFLETELGWIVITLSVVGLISLLFADRRILIALLISVLLSVGWSMRYQIEDFSEYLMPVFLVSAIFLAQGIREIFSHKILRNSRNASVAILIAFAAVPVIQFWKALPVADQSSNHLVDDFSTNLLANVRPNSVVLVANWQYSYPGLLYRQTVNKERSDVIVLNKEFLANSWYYDHLTRYYPDVLVESRHSVEQFLKYLERYEDGLTFDPNLLISHYHAVIRDLIASAIKHRPVYVGAEIEPGLTAGFRRVPEGLLFRLTSEGGDPEMLAPSITYRPTSFRSPATEDMKRFYSWILTASAFELRKRQRFAEASTAATLAASIDSTFVPAQTMQKKLRAIVP